MRKVILDEPSNCRRFFPADASYGEESDFEKTNHSCFVDYRTLIIVSFLSVLDDRKDFFPCRRIKEFIGYHTD